MPRHNKRWEPPHPATEERPPRIPAPPTPRPAHTWQDIAHELVPEHLCTWDGCDSIRYRDFPICLLHVLYIEDFLAANSSQDAALARADRNAKRRNEAEHQARRTAHLNASRGAAPGWIYYVLTDGKVKIGYSADITRRLRAYPPGSKILAVHPGTPDLEKLMHQRFGAYRVAGREWFRPDQEILDYCDQVVAEHGDPALFAPKVRDPHDANRVVAGKHMNRRW